jgi:serine protease Do
VKFRDVLALIVLVAVAIGGKVYRDGIDNPPPDRRPDPRLFEPPAARAPDLRVPDSRDEGPVLPRESPNDPALIVKSETKRNSATGTAFSINRDGVWFTARHVTNGCDAVGLEKSGGRLVRVQRISEYPSADISILWTRGGSPAMPVGDPTLRVGQAGYSFGYPKGDPGDVYAKIIGRNRMLARGRYNTDEPVIAWTQVRRVPDIGSDLSGISGGPWVNAAGEVIGIHVAGAPRRGRSYSTAPRTMREAIGRAGVRPEADSGNLPAPAALTPGRFQTYGQQLRRQLTVAKVICLVGERWRRS